MRATEPTPTSELGLFWPSLSKQCCVLVEFLTFCFHFLKGAMQWPLLPNVALTSPARSTKFG